jgi:1-deoxy-D-xylulose-5-phosphate synthase
VVELTLAMHYVFDTPKDSFVFDVSHQAYVHKLLTGRAGALRHDSAAGRAERLHAADRERARRYGAGHAGTALSAALGMAVARDLRGRQGACCGAGGDAAFTNGISFEALNNIADQTKRLIVVLNDNEWSIDAMSARSRRYLHKIVTNEHVSHLHGARPDCWSGWRQGRAACGARRRGGQGTAVAVDVLRGVRADYYGPLDGHNLPLLIETFKFLKSRTSRWCCMRSRRRGAAFSRRWRSRRSFMAWGRTIRRRARPSRRAEDLLRDICRDAGEAGR